MVIPKWTEADKKALNRLYRTHGERWTGKPKEWRATGNVRRRAARWASGARPRPRNGRWG